MARKLDATWDIEDDAWRWFEEKVENHPRRDIVNLNEAEDVDR